MWELLKALVRNWPIVIIGALVTTGTGLAAATADGVYFTRTELMFLAPTSTANPNALRTQSEDLIITAGLVAKRVTGPDAPTKFASPDVTLVGLGMREGWSLRVPDIGGQWASNFATQRLFLDVVAPSEQAVQQQQRAIIDEVTHELDALQREWGVDPVNTVSVIAAPESTVIHYVDGNRSRALAMTALLGLGATVAVVVLREYVARRGRDDIH
ncbi:hypothetical protein L332_08865 [Agrococcus pavilionensis RW1]|uniref:Polysaccharide chain length determinant N-terminal domain-containing protein n=1 Tax=Agrococcus pavilionensis RW1 TaxID=1330458 RepID=U1LR70_9MICO|nr:hypothetical protein L332_08865 [Agrococcus pavilionensis RW1]